MGFLGKKTLASACALIVPALVLSLFALRSRESVSSETGGGPPVAAGPPLTEKPAENPIPVKAVAAWKGDFVVKLNSLGEAFAENKAVLRSLVPGVVRNLFVEEGQSVKAGDPIMDIDDTEYRLRLERQEAVRLKALSELLLEKGFGKPGAEPGRPFPEDVSRSKEEFERALALYQKGLIPREDLEDARGRHERAVIAAGGKREEIMASSKGLTQAEAEVEIARLEVDKTRTRAPFAGIVTNVRVSAREHVSAFQEICTVVDPGRIRLLAKVLESDIGKIAPGGSVDLRFSAFPEETFRGIVRSLGPLIDPADRTCSVYIDVDNSSGKIKPGMHAEVETVAEVYRRTLLVPQQAVLVRGGRTMLFVVEDGTAKWRYVKIGHENEKTAEVLEGLGPGELVITEGHFALAHDARVRVIR